MSWERKAKAVNFDVIDKAFWLHTSNYHDFLQINAICLLFPHLGCDADFALFIFINLSISAWVKSEFLLRIFNAARQVFTVARKRIFIDWKTHKQTKKKTPTRPSEQSLAKCICKFIAYFCIATLTFHKVVPSFRRGWHGIKSMLATTTTKRVEKRARTNVLVICFYLEHNSIYFAFWMRVASISGQKMCLKKT